MTENEHRRHFTEAPTHVTQESLRFFDEMESPEGNGSVYRLRFMAPVSEIRKLHPRVCNSLRAFSFIGFVRNIAALGVMPQFHANTFRLELLTHLAAVECRGATCPSRDEFEKLLLELEGESPLIGQEDPVEDVFLSCVNTPRGTFRVFTGIFADGAYIVERLFYFLVTKESFPTFAETVEAALGLLRLTELLAKRCALPRYFMGGGASGGELEVPSEMILRCASEAVSFSENDLKAAGLTLASLDEFILSDEHRDAIQDQRLWSSNLERRPLLKTDSGVVVAEPSTVCRALTRYMLERILLTKMGGWAETFFQQECAGIFVNDVARGLDIKGLEFSAPSPPPNLPPLLPFFGTFDLGKPVIMLTHTSPFEPAVTEPDGFDSMSDEAHKAVTDYIRACVDKFEKRPGFSGGMILTASVGVGRGGDFAFLQLDDKWVCHTATLQDWEMLSRDGDCSAMRLWKLGMQEHDFARRDARLMNAGGLLALWGLWKRSGYCLFHPDMDINAPNNMLMVACDFGASPRRESQLKNDVHYVLSHDGSQYRCLHRLHPNTLFPDSEIARCYGDVDAAKERRLIGCVETESERHWWVVAPRIDASPHHLDLMFQLWECVLQWLERALPIIGREYPDFRPCSVEIRMELPDFARWEISPKLTDTTQTAPLIVEAKRSENSFVLTIPEGFLPRFNQPQNIAEMEILGALLSGISRLAEVSIAPEKIAALALEITGGTSARFFHIVESTHLETNLRVQRATKPLFVPEEDSTFARVGLADLAGRPTSQLQGKEACQKFLEDTVTKVWERVEKRLQRFDRVSVVIECFEAMDELSRDAEHFDMTTRSIRALHTNEEDTHSVLRHRRAKQHIAEFANRLIIETAQYAAVTENGIQLTKADHGVLLAEFELLLTMAHHRDAIANDFIAPDLRILPRGDIVVDERFYEEVLKKYHTRRYDQHMERASEGYDSYFSNSTCTAGVPDSAVTKEVEQFASVFETEFGFSSEQLGKVAENWRQVAIATGRPGGLVQEKEMFPILMKGAGMTLDQAKSFVTRFTLPIRDAWDANLPQGCRKEDVFPWRFRRRVSLLMRPFVEVRKNPRTWVVWAPVFEKAMEYVTGHIARGSLPDQFFTTPQMRSYIGSRVDKRGHDFALKVHDELQRLGFTTRLEIRLTELGAPKQPDLGDVDVLAWQAGKKTVFAIECKSLSPALTVREIVQRLEDFRGDEKRKDSLGKHVRRSNWLTANRSGLARVTGIAADEINLVGLLVCSDLVPMQFFREMNFAPERVLTLGELPKVETIS